MDSAPTSLYHFIYSCDFLTYPWYLSVACSFAFSNSSSAISGDFFINWRNGGRKIIPVGVSYRRAKKVIDDAIATGGVVNFWLHPHNLITGDRQFDLLRMIVEYVSKLDKEGMIESCTQKDLLISGPWELKLTQSDRAPFFQI